MLPSPPNIYPPLPNNMPGSTSPGVPTPPTLVPGVYQNFFQPQNQAIVLATQLGVPLQPPVFVPPVTFQLIPPT